MINKAINQYGESLDNELDDLFIFQRGEQYFSQKRQNVGGGLQKITYELTQAELDALFTTPVEVIPAQGVNTYIEIVTACAFRNGTAFTAGDAVLKCVYTGATQSIFQSAAGFLTRVAATAVDKFLPVTAAGQNLTANTGVSMYLTQNPTSTGTVTIEIIYRVYTFT